jgi:hypothetical protein
MHSSAQSVDTSVTHGVHDDALLVLKDNIKTFTTAKEADTAALAECLGEIRILRTRVVALKAAKGGETAIADNAAALSRETELMERRLVKTREYAERQRAKNIELRAGVDERVLKRNIGLQHTNCWLLDMQAAEAEGCRADGVRDGDAGHGAPG